jgi:hypothetical protein
MKYTLKGIIWNGSPIWIEKEKRFNVSKIKSDKFEKDFFLFLLEELNIFKYIFIYKVFTFKKRLIIIQS